MFVSVEQVQIGVNNFIENEIAKKAVGANKFMVYFAMPVISQKIGGYVKQFSQNKLTKEFFDSEGKVNIDDVYNLAKSAIKKSGQFVLYGIVLNETDIDKLYNYIKEVGESV